MSLGARNEPGGEVGCVGLTRPTFDDRENRRTADNPEACSDCLGGPEEDRHARSRPVGIVKGRERRDNDLRTGGHLLEKRGIVHAPGDIADLFRKIGSGAPRDSDHLVPAGGKPPRQRTADETSAEYDDLHLCLVYCSEIERDGDGSSP
ncbi:hypothetical protein GCM10009789_85800 [Kribbella sancticallisti]|uniref:Uncharacterized protein n=1 Tax=Kribbella sancticallisti TaxID=460087 RepID=A0ABP4QSG2_9ACTN